MMDRNIILNSIKTPDGTVLVSRHVHDYVTHTDAITGKEYMVDGGLAYLRRSMHEDQVDMTLYDDAPHEIQRNLLTWGNAGKDGKGPTQYKTIAEMDTDHLTNILNMIDTTGLNRTWGVAPHIKKCMEKELEYRLTKGQNYDI